MPSIRNYNDHIGNLAALISDLQATLVDIGDSYPGASDHIQLAASKIQEIEDHLFHADCELENDNS